MDDIKNMYCKDTDEWISVEDKLPQDNGMIQKFLISKDIPSATCGPVTIETAYFTDRFRGHNKITHWMPLPERPKK